MKSVLDFRDVYLLVYADFVIEGIFFGARYATDRLNSFSQHADCVFSKKLVLGT